MSTTLPTTASPTALTAAQRLKQAQPVDLPTGKLAYTIKEFCKAVGIGQTKVYGELKSGRLKSVMRAGRRLILAKDAMAWLESDSEPDGPDT